MLMNSYWCFTLWKAEQRSSIDVFSLNVALETIRQSLKQWVIHCKTIKTTRRNFLTGNFPIKFSELTTRKKIILIHERIDKREIFMMRKKIIWKTTTYIKSTYSNYNLIWIHSLLAQAQEDFFLLMYETVFWMIRLEWLFIAPLMYTHTHVRAVTKNSIYDNNKKKCNKIRWLGHQWWDFC